VPLAIEALLALATEPAVSLRTARPDLLGDGRDVALELRRLVHGDLRGMFDGCLRDSNGFALLVRP
jgi:hypothetical protein